MIAFTPHLLLRALAGLVIAGWAAVSYGGGPFADVRVALDRAYPDSAVRGFLEQAPRGAGLPFVEPGARDGADTLLALRTYQPDAFVGEFDRLGQRAAESIAVTVERVYVESALEDRATVVARATFRPGRRERLGNFEERVYTFLDRHFDARFTVVRRDGGWYLASVPPFIVK